MSRRQRSAFDGQHTLTQQQLMTWFGSLKGESLPDLTLTAMSELVFLALSFIPPHQSFTEYLKFEIKQHDSSPYNSSDPYFLTASLIDYITTSFRSHRYEPEEIPPQDIQLFKVLFTYIQTAVKDQDDIYTLLSRFVNKGFKLSNIERQAYNELQINITTDTKWQSGTQSLLVAINGEDGNTRTAIVNNPANILRNPGALGIKAAIHHLALQLSALQNRTSATTPTHNTLENYQRTHAMRTRSLSRLAIQQTNAALPHAVQSYLQKADPTPQETLQVLHVIRDILNQKKKQVRVNESALRGLDLLSCGISVFINSDNMSSPSEITHQILTEFETQQQEANQPDIYNGPDAAGGGSTKPVTPNIDHLSSNHRDAFFKSSISKKLKLELKQIQRQHYERGSHILKPALDPEVETLSVYAYTNNNFERPGVYSYQTSNIYRYRKVGAQPPATKLIRQFNDIPINVDAQKQQLKALFIERPGIFKDFTWMITVTHFKPQIKKDPHGGIVNDTYEQTPQINSNSPIMETPPATLTCIAIYSNNPTMLDPIKEWQYEPGGLNLKQIKQDVEAAFVESPQGKTSHLHV